MGELKHKIRAALQSNGRIDRAQVREWIGVAADVETEALLYELTDVAWARIEPRLESDETCALIQRYLLRCICEDPQDGTSLTRYEAAAQLEAWLDHLADQEHTRETVAKLVAAVSDLFVNSDDDVRRAVETGFLEHVLEQERLRPLFVHWADDDRLREAWEMALAWGLAHPDFVKRLRQGLGSEDLQEPPTSE